MRVAGHQRAYVDVKYVICLTQINIHLKLQFNKKSLWADFLY